ncbi:MAG: RNA polymerase sigma-70 factor [Cyclobacteriaceae bacterium]
MDTSKQNKELLKRIALKDDEQAFNTFFDLYHLKLIQFALLFVPQIDQAEDVVSNVMIRLIKNADKVFAMENMEGYLFMAVKNEAINFLKKEGKHKNNISDIDTDFFSHEFVDPMEKLLEKELRQLISNTVEALPLKRKMVYKLIKDEGLKYQEVADLMDISKRTVEVHLKLAVKELRIAVRNYMSENKDNPGYMGIVKALYTVLMVG